jgi:hypothetical protein
VHIVSTLPTLQQQVGLLSRNIVIQGGDEETTNKQMYGVHTMARFGGWYRVENAEFRS